MKKLWILALALCLLLSGCSLPFSFGEAEDVNTMAVYRVYTGDEGGALIRAEECVLDDGVQGDAALALSLLCAESEQSDLRCALPEGVSLEDWSLEGSVATLSFSENFREAPDMEKTAAAFCAALTLCNLDEVDAVTICADGEILFQGLVADDALLEDRDSDPYTRRLRLYFADAEGRYLVSEYHSLSLDEDSSLERYVVEELLRGPNDPSLRPAIPAGTKLLSCVTEGGVCTVDLSREFLDNRPQTALGERLAIYAIVNSLGVLADVESVRILCEGQSVPTYLYRSLAEPLESLPEAVGPASAAKGQMDMLLFRPLPGLQALAAMPCAVNVTGYESEAWALAAALMDRGEPGYPSVFYGTGSLLSIDVTGYSCTVDVTESFFASLTAEERAAAVGSLSASLCSLDNIRSVFFTMNGQEAVFEGVSYTGPWNHTNINITE